LQLVTSQSVNSSGDAHKLLLCGREVRMLQLVTSQSENSGEDAHILLTGGRDVGCCNWWRHNLQTQVRRSQIATRRPWGWARQLVTSQLENSGEDAHKLLLWAPWGRLLQLLTSQSANSGNRSQTLPRVCEHSEYWRCHHLQTMSK